MNLKIIKNGSKNPMKIYSIVAIVLNILWLTVIIFFVFAQGVESYDIIGWSVLTLVIATPLVNLYVLLYSQRK